MRRTTRRTALADHEADIFPAMFFHSPVERDGLRFAIRRPARLCFRRSFPDSREAVGNRSQVSNPLIDQPERKLGLAILSRGEENGFNPAHLMIIRSGFDRHEDGGGLGRRAGKADQNQKNKEKPFQEVGVEAYCNHMEYDY